MTKHKELTELAEKTDAVNVDMTNKMKYYELLEKRSMCKLNGWLVGNQDN